MTGRYSLSLTRARAGAGFDGAELPVVARAPFASRPGPASAPAVEDNGPRAELRARLRAEVDAALAAPHEREIDPSPSSRPQAIRGQVAWAELGAEENEEDDRGDDLEGAMAEVRGEGGGFEMSYSEENDARRGEW